VAREGSDRLSEDDAHILAVESTEIFGHTLKLVILEPAEQLLDIDELRAAVARRLPTQPRTLQARRHLRAPLALGYGNRIRHR
jgi:hypothetical protein